MSSIFSSKQKSSSTSIMEPNVPGWASGPLQDAVSLAADYAATPYTEYDGGRIAGFTDDELRAFDMTRDLLGQGLGDLQTGRDISREVARQGLEGIDQDLLQQYMNPYTENVMDVQKRRSLEEFDRAKRAQQQQAAQIGAFGGSRTGLAEQELYDKFGQRLGEQEAAMLADRYNQGLSAAERSLTRAGQAGMDLTNQAITAQNYGLQDIGALNAQGGQQRALEQAGLDVGYENFLREQQDPFMKAQGLASIGLPIAQLHTGSTTDQMNRSSSTPSPFSMAQQAAGMLTGLGGMGSAMMGGSSLGGWSAPTALGRSFGLGNQKIGLMDYFDSGARRDIAYANAGGQGPYRFNRGGLIESNPNSYSVGGSIADYFKTSGSQLLGGLQDLITPDIERVDPYTSTPLEKVENFLGNISKPKNWAQMGHEAFAEKPIAYLANMVDNIGEYVTTSPMDREYALQQQMLEEAMGAKQKPVEGLPSSQEVLQEFEDVIKEKAPQDSHEVAPESRSGGDGGYDELLKQLRTQVQGEPKKKSVFEDPLFNWGLALVTGGDPVAAYRGMSGEGKNQRFEAVEKEQALRDMARDKVQSDAYRKQVDVQAAAAKTAEERDLANQLIRAQILESLNKSMGKPSVKDVVSAWGKFMQKADMNTLQNPQLFNEYKMAGAKSIAAQLNMTPAEVAEILNSLGQ